MNQDFSLPLLAPVSLMLSLCSLHYVSSVPVLLWKSFVLCAVFGLTSRVSFVCSVTCPPLMFLLHSLSLCVYVACVSPAVFTFTFMLHTRVCSSGLCLCSKIVPMPQVHAVFLPRKVCDKSSSPAPNLTHYLCFCFFYFLLVPVYWTYNQ